VALRGGDAAVEGDRGLQEDEGTPARSGDEEPLVERARLRFRDADGDGKPGAAQRAQAGAVHLRVRVLDGDHDAPHAGRRDHRGARRRPSVVRAGLESDVQRGPASVRGRAAKRSDLGMLASGAAMERLADHAAALDHDASHHRVWVGLSAPAAGERERPAHPRLVVGDGGQSPMSPREKASASKVRRSSAASPTPT
jgi:hypothetical protein